MLDPNTIVYCYGCERRVRAKITKLVPTGVDEELERWCLDCLSEIDEATKFALNPPTDTSPPDLEDEIQRFLQDNEEGK